MEKKTVKKKVTTAKKASKKAVNEITVDPFETLADTTAPEKRPATKRRAIKVDAAPALDDTAASPVTSPVKKTAKKAAAAKKPTAKAVKTKTKGAVAADADELVTSAEREMPDTETELSPVFKKLADPQLPELKRENRARLQMQTPTRLYFYWSVKDDPWSTLRGVFGDDLGSYTLVLKLSDLTNGTEEIHRCDAEGNWWFSVAPSSKYRAEIGFYAPNRPYFRVIYSNIVETPRRSPSPHRASEAQWTVSANKFAEVLDASGFSRDAFDVAVAGDNYTGVDNSAHIAFSQFVDVGQFELDQITAEDIRYAMTAIASGATLEELRFRISASLFAILQSNADRLTSDRAMGALRDHFDIDEADYTTEQLGPAVFGASLVNFPRTLRSRVRRAEYRPVSSHEFHR